ncbi:MAG TPA: ABC transporter permease [Bacteroidia bacterium]|nr:ABC transporter permease [Bacteroidia bacterium]
MSVYNQSYSSWKRFNKNFAVRFAIKIAVAFILISLFANVIANEKPLIAKYNTQIFFPAFRSMFVDAGITGWQDEFKNADWKNLSYEWSIFPPIPYSPQSFDIYNIHSVSPLDKQNVASVFWRHWLGTDELGRDVLAGLIHGTRTALTIGILAMSLAALLGVIIGTLAGYFGDDRIKISLATFIVGIIFFFPALFLSFVVRVYEITDALAISLEAFIIQLIISFLMLIASLYLSRLVAIPLKRISFFKKKISVPLDLIISRFIETVDSLPILLILIALSSIILKPTIYLPMFVIGMVSWTTIAKLTRAEMLRIRSLEYIEAAQVLGIPSFKIIIKHALPNALAPVLVTIAFGIASTVLIESSLSFLGIGVPAEMVTWGSMLASAHQSPSSWWLAVFPGIAIFITVYVFNILGEGLANTLNPKQKNFLGLIIKSKKVHHKLI